MKPKIIIADTNYDYIIALQAKFADKFNYKVDIEIITSEEYFQQLFSTPQTVDTLIVSENLYNESLIRHNIKQTAIMVEKQGFTDNDDSGVKKIYKYKNLVDIFSEIVGSSQELLNIDSDVENKECKIIVVTSATGGAGKTTVALGISGAIEKNINRVLYLNATKLQSFQHMMENKDVLDSVDVYSSFSGNEMELYDNVKRFIRREKFSYLPELKVPLLSLGISPKAFADIAIGAKNSGEYDYIIVDTDSNFDEDMIRLLDIADKVLLISNQNVGSISATNKLVSNLNDYNQDKYVCICNKYDEDKRHIPYYQERLVYQVIENIVELGAIERAKTTQIAELMGVKKVAMLVM